MFKLNTMSKKLNSKSVIARTRVPIQDNKTTDAILQKKLVKIAELHQGMDILRGRMTEAKKDLISHMDQNKHLKTPKYTVGDRYIRYLDKPTNDGLSQKLITQGLIAYFNSLGHNKEKSESEAKLALKTILDCRTTKIVPTVDITKDKNKSGNSEVDDLESTDDLA